MKSFLLESGLIKKQICLQVNSDLMKPFLSRQSLDWFVNTGPFTSLSVMGTRRLMKSSPILPRYSAIPILLVFLYLLIFREGTGGRET